MKFVLPILLLIVQLVYTKSLVQKNPEELFLTDEGKVKFQQFKKEFPSNSKVIAFLEASPSKELYREVAKDAKKVKELCQEACDVLLPHELYRSKESFLKGLEASEFKESSLVTSEMLGFVIFSKTNSPEIEKKLIIELKNKYNLVGHSYINYLLDEYSKVIQVRIFPLVFLTSFLLVFALTKSFTNSLILFYMPILSSLLSLTVIKLIFGYMNMVTSIVGLITFIISLSISLHLYFTALEYKSFRKAFSIKKKPIVLMILTTFIGFCSLGISNIQVIRQFGLLSGSLILITASISIVWLQFTNKEFSFKKLHFDKFLNNFPQKTASLSVVIFLFFFSIGAAVFGVKNISIVTDASNYFSDRPEIRESIVKSNSLSGGIPLFEINIKKDEHTYNYYKKLSQIELMISAINGVQIRSDLESIRRINQDYSGKSTISDNRFSFNTLKSRIPKIINSNGLNEDEPYYKMTILGIPSDVDKFSELVREVKAHLSGLDYKINGLFYNLMTSQKEMISTLFYSFFISLSLMSLIVLIVFKKFNIFISFLFVNLCPVGISLMLYSIFGLSLNIATVMTYSIGLGIVVDSSFHLYASLEKDNFSFSEYFLTTLLPIISSTIILILCFGSFVFYGFLPIREFGISLTLIVLLGFLFDVFVLPTICKGSNTLNS